jgi:hypothetical protein
MRGKGDHATARLTNTDPRRAILYHARLRNTFVLTPENLTWPNLKRDNKESPVSGLRQIMSGNLAIRGSCARQSVGIRPSAVWRRQLLRTRHVRFSGAQSHFFTASPRWVAVKRRSMNVPSSTARGIFGGRNWIPGKPSFAEKMKFERLTCSRISSRGNCGSPAHSCKSLQSDRVAFRGLPTIGSLC